MLPEPELQKYVQYIRNTAQAPLPTAAFDDDWEPIGPTVRVELIASGLAVETAGGPILAPARPSDPGDLPLGLIIMAGLRALAYSGSESQVQNVIERANELLLDEPPPYAIDVRLDLAKSVNEVVEGFCRVPGEGLRIGPVTYRVHGRVHDVDADGRYEACLLVERLGPPPAIVPAAAGAVDQLERKGGLIRPGFA